jgi:hypothetical protein
MTEARDQIQTPMKGRDTPLREATQVQLVEELARRLNENVRDEPPEFWCDNCVHFRTTTGRALELKPHWNPCAKKHQVSFYVPQPHDSPDTFGYYVEVCPDRTPIPEPPPPDPPPPPPRGRKPKAVP